MSWMRERVGEGARLRRPYMMSSTQEHSRKPKAVQGTPHASGHMRQTSPKTANATTSAKTPQTMRFEL